MTVRQPLEELRATWMDGGVATNGWLMSADPFVAETLAAAGADVVTVDLQHGLASRERVPELVRAIEVGGAIPFVRLPSGDPDLIGWLLDLGVCGVICPTVESASQARALVAAARYPPAGVRSFGPLRAARTIGGDYLTASGDLVAVIAMIESVAGLDAAAKIADVDGLDGLFIGPGDLGISLGLGPAQDRREPKILEAIDAVLALTAARGQVAGIHADSAAYAREMADRGFGLVTVTSDIGALTRAVTADLTRFRG